MNDTHKTALVTGANKGIGFETAKQLAERGYVVWLGCRDEARGVAAAKKLAGIGDVRFVRLDVADDESVRAAAATVAQKTNALDALVNNAGILVKEDGPPSSVPLDALDRTFAANFVGALRVTQAFLPLLKRAAAGRIVNVSSTMGSVGTLVDALSSPEHALVPLLEQYPNFAYAASKTGMSALTAWLAYELRGTPIKVNALCPGYNATDMNDHKGTQPPSEGAKLVVRAATLGSDGPTGTFYDASGALAW